VRGEDLYLAERRDAQLHARTAQLHAGDALLDDPPVASELGEIGRKHDVGVLERHLLDATRQRRTLVGRARRR
jgi:hypothetical protein